MDINSFLIYKELKSGYSIAFNKNTNETVLIKGEINKFSSEELTSLFEFTQTESQFDARKVLSTIVINVTEACNLRCKYCSRYKGHYDIKQTITLDLLKDILYKASLYANEIGEKVVVQFHGGEPLTQFGLIRKAIEENQESNSNLDFRIQTNATLLNEEILLFCKEYDIHLGLSIDGPPELNAVTRKFKNGRNINSSIERIIPLIKKYLPRHTISCLCVLSAANAHYAEDVLEYVFNNSIDDVSILPLYPDFSNCITDDNHLIPRTVDMVKFSSTVFDIWVSELRKGHVVSIPNFQIWFWNLMGNNANYLLNSTSCGVGQSLIFIDKDGEIYPCGPFSYEKKFSMGNITSISSINEIRDSEIFKSFLRRTVNNIVECKDCVFQGICLGGCPANSYLKHRDIFKKDPFCEYWEGVIGHIVQRLIEDPDICGLIPEYSIRL